MSAPDPAPRSDGRLRLLVVDADDRVRESLTGLLAIGEQLEVVGSAGQAQAVIDLVLASRPDVVVIDPRLPDVDAGSALIARLRTAAPGTLVLAMSWSDALDSLRIECGADGCIRKTFRASELVAAILGAIRPAPVAIRPAPAASDQA